MRLRSEASSLLVYFHSAIAFTIIGLALGAIVGWLDSGTLSGTLTAFFICLVLATLEISISFDNAIVNANKLKTMTEVWRRRFLTWGILIAVFGMRVVFPLVIVSVAGGIDPWTALKLASFAPDAYAKIMVGSHLQIAAFGGTFLLMVGLTYFFDDEKSVHWIGFVEDRMARFAAVKGIEIAVALLTVLLFAALVPDGKEGDFLYAAVYGLVTFLLVEALGGFLDLQEQTLSTAARGGLGAFVYLEVLDASFSFDGVIGAFALSHNLWIIAIGLGIGAAYVRSLTLMMVERGTLTHYRYLEHGAFWAIIALALVMFTQTILHIPEVITGLIGAGLIAVAYWSSVRRPG